MTILVATPLSSDESGGPAKHVHMLQEELPQHGFDLIVVSFKDVRSLPMGIRHLKYLWLLWREASSTDVLYALDASSVGFPAAMVAWLRRKRLIVRVPGIHAWEQSVQRYSVTDTLDEFVMRTSYPLGVYRWLLTQKFVFNVAERIITPSHYMKGIVEKCGVLGTNVNVVYSSFEQTFGDEVLEKERSEYVIVSVGRLVPWKGFAELIGMMSSLREKIPDARLIIIGDGPERKNLESLVHTKNLEQTVTLAGALANQEVLDQLTDESVFALNTRYEGFSHLLLEAADAGAPIVTTNVGGNPELVHDGENGRLLAHGDTDAFAEAIIEILEHPDRARQYARAAKQTIEQFNKEKSVEQLVKFFNKN